MVEEQYTSRAERRRSSTRAAPARSGGGKRIAAGLAAVVLAGGLGVGAYSLMNRGDSTKDADSSRDACAGARIAVAAAPSISPALTKALQGFTGSKDAQGCARTYSVQTIASSDLIEQMKTGSPSAQLWVADSPQWYRTASSVTKTPITPSSPFAASPVVISGPKAQLAKLGAPAAWAKVLKAQPALSVDDATTDRASALAITQASQTLGTTAEAKSALGQLARAPRGTIAKDAPHVTTEAALAQFDAKNGGSLAEVGLQGGSPLVTYAAAPLVTDDPATQAALKELTSRLASGQGRAAMASAGFRDATGTSAPTNAPDGSAKVTPGPAPDEQKVAATLATWKAATQPLRMTAVFDVSGSMAAKTGDTSRIETVSQTALRVLDIFPTTTQVSLWEFSTNRDGTKPYKELVTMGPISDPAQMTKLRDGAKKLPSDLGGDTGLYDTIWAAYQSAQKDYTPGSVSSVTLLTDGRNDTTGGLSLEQLEEKLKAAKDAKRPVRVTTIALGPEVDTDALSAIAKVTGGRVYEAADASQVPRVLSESSFDRS